MAYPTSFGTLPDQQSLGSQNINVYPTLAALGLEQGLIQPGSIVAVQSPVFMLLMAQSSAANGQYAVSSTSSTQIAGGGGVTYWVQDMSGGSVLQNPQQAPYTARVAPLAVAAYGGTGTGTLTLTSAAAWTADGVVLALGDVIFLQTGLTNLTAVDSGPWVVSVLGTASVKTVLRRPSWFATGMKIPAGLQVAVGSEGAFFANTTFKATAAPGTVVDTTDCAFYVKSFTFQRTLVSGTLALAAGQPTLLATSATCPVGIYSLTQSTATCIAAAHGGTLTGTVSYACVNASSTQAFTTIGAVGTSAMAVFAIATANATQTNDTSTLNVTITNFN